MNFEFALILILIFLAMAAMHLLQRYLLASLLELEKDWLSRPLAYINGSLVILLGAGIHWRWSQQWRELCWLYLAGGIACVGLRFVVIAFDYRDMKRQMDDDRTIIKTLKELKALYQQLAKGGKA